MQLVEAVILLLVGMVPGVWMTLADVYAVGASAFSAHVSVWLLLVMALATNTRYRRQASLGGAALSFGYIETYYLCSSFTFAGMARSTMVPLALLTVVGAVVASVGWAAKRERGALGLALKALVIVATLVACVATHDGVSSVDVVCTLVIAYLLLFMRSRKLALEHHRPDPTAVAAGHGEQEEPRRRTAHEVHKTPRRNARPTGARDRGAVRRRRPAEPKGAGVRAAVASAGRARAEALPEGRRSAGESAGTGMSSSRHTPSRSSSRTPGARPARAKATTDKGPTGSPRQKADKGRGSARSMQRPASGGRSKQRTQRPTRRTGGAVPEANRLRSSASDHHGQSGPRQHRSGESQRRR